ncbi:MAG: BMP family protein [Armatimonadetes bacterium]|nr:BMP family protein [Armatimonadota bacterium]
MKRLPISPLAIIALASLAGCDGDSKPEAAKLNDDDFKVALITPGPVNDSGWSALAYRGLEAIKLELGADTQNIVAFSPQDIKDAMRSYAQKDFDLVIGHGYEYNQIGIEVAKDFPKTVFISSSGDKTATNVGTFRFNLEQGTYVLGMVAAKLSLKGTLGMVGGPNVPSIESTFRAFEAGAKAVRPSVRVLKAYTNSNDDIGAAKQQTLAFIAQGADYIIHQANAAAQGVFEACKERGAFAFGTNSDQAGAAPDVVIASATINAGPVFVELAKQLKEGKFKAGVRLRGMADGAVGIVWNPNPPFKIPEDIKAEAILMVGKIVSGQLKVPRLEF